MVGKFQEKAKKEGIELPPVFTQIDRTTGMPSILAVSSDDGEKKTPEELIRVIVHSSARFIYFQAVEAVVQKAEAEVKEPSPPPPPPPPIVRYDADTQTEILLIIENEVSQTSFEFETFIQMSSKCSGANGHSRLIHKRNTNGHEFMEYCRHYDTNELAGDIARCKRADDQC
jgi:hypothetical protein